MGCFADQEAAALLSRALRDYEKQKPKGNYYNDVLAREFKEHEEWNVHYPDRNKNLNVIMVHSGFGDGVYSSYWGIDGSGKVVCLVTDFQLFTLHGTIFDK